MESQKWISSGSLERFAIWWNRKPLRTSFFAAFSAAKPVSTFAENALADHLDDDPADLLPGQARWLRFRGSLDLAGVFQELRLVL